MSRLFILFFIMIVNLPLLAQVPPQVLIPGQSTVGEIAGGESHTYQIALTAKQFVTFRLAQQTVDATLTLTAPDGKQLGEMDLNGVGEEEAFSLEALLPGSYRLMVQGKGGAALRGAYRLETTVQNTATASDRKHMTAQTFFVEAGMLAKEMPKTAPQVIEKLEMALSR